MDQLRYRLRNRASTVIPPFGLLRVTRIKAQADGSSIDSRKRRAITTRRRSEIMTSACWTFTGARLRLPRVCLTRIPLMRTRLTRIAVLILVASTGALLTNCGGGGGDSIAPPTQPPVQPPVTPTTGTVPASITVMNGDGQTGEPGATLPVQPRVVVKDAAGLVVPSASVAFAIDSGNGTIERTTAITGTDGTASAGNWKLGASEGRNVIRASVAAIPSAKIAASARVEPTTLPVQTVGSAGGTVTISRPGSSIDGMTINFPNGSFAAPIDVQIGYQSSATLPVVADLRVASPIITLTTSGPDASNVMYRVKIPMAISPEEFPVIAIVNQSTGFVEALTTVDYDANSVTAIGSALDATVDVERSASAAFRAWFPSQSLQGQASKNVQLAVLLVEKTKIRNLIIDTKFRPGFDDWEFDPAVTPVYNGSTSSGAVVTERYYFRTKKSMNSGTLSKRFQEATGAVGSNAAGLRWNKEISEQFEAQLPRHVAPAQIERERNAIKYDSLVLQNIVVSMIASEGAPQIVAFKNLNTGDITTVLAYKWDGPSGLLYDANPALPGDATRKSTWNAKGFQCTNSCLAVIGINHIIGYQTKLDAQWPGVLDGTINKSFVPPGFISSHGAIVGKSPSIGFDTLFVPDDTTRIWVECPTCAGQQATQLPLKHGGAGIGTQKIYHEISRNAWAPSTVAPSTNGFFLNLKQFPVANQNKWANFNLGIEGRGFQTAGTQFGASAGNWIGWKTLRIIKFAPLLVFDKDAAVSVPATFIVETEGGPGLPTDATYEFKWGDGTTTTRTTNPGSLQHTYQRTGTLAVSLRVLHPTGQLIAKYDGSINVRAPSISFTLAGPWDASKQPSNGTYNYPSLSDSRVRLSGSSGLDQIGFVYNVGSKDAIGVFVAIQLPSGTVIKTGDTFTKFVNGGPAGGRFQFLLSNNQTDADAPDARQYVPDGTGTLAFDDVTLLSTGTWAVNYSFTITNTAGGTIMGRGVARWN